MGLSRRFLLHCCLGIAAVVAVFLAGVSAVDVNEFKVTSNKIPLSSPGSLPPRPRLHPRADSHAGSPNLAPGDVDLLFMSPSTMRFIDSIPSPTPSSASTRTQPLRYAPVLAHINLCGFIRLAALLEARLIVLRGRGLARGGSPMEAAESLPSAAALVLAPLTLVVVPAPPLLVARRCCRAASWIDGVRRFALLPSEETDLAEAPPPWASTTTLLHLQAGPTLAPPSHVSHHQQGGDTFNPSCLACRTRILYETRTL